MKRCIRGEAVAKAVRAVEGGVKADHFGIFLDEEVHRIFTEMCRSDLAALQDLPEKRPFVDTGGFQPVIECTDAVHFFRHILEIGDADLLPLSPLVRFRAFDVKDDALRKFLDIFHGQRDDLTSAESAHETDEEDRAIAQAVERFEIHAGNHLLKLLKIHRRFPFLQHAFLPREADQRFPDDPCFRRIFLHEAGRIEILRQRGNAAADGRRLRIVREVIDIVHDRFRRGRERFFFMVCAPVAEVIPVRLIGVDGMLRLRLRQRQKALVRECIVMGAFREITDIEMGGHGGLS